MSSQAQQAVSAAIEAFPVDDPLVDPIRTRAAVAGLTFDQRDLLSVFSSRVRARDFPAARVALAVALALDMRRCMRLARRLGVFRTWRDLGAATGLRAAARDLASQAAAWGLDEADQQYLATVATLLEVAGALEQIAEPVLGAARHVPGELAGGALATLEAVWLLGHRWPALEQFRPALDSLSREDLAEGFSYIWFHCMSGGLDVTPSVDPAQVESGRYVPFLIAAALVRGFAALEILVDRLGYVVRRDAGRHYSINAPRPDVEMAIRLGFIAAEQQSTLAGLRAMQHPDRAYQPLIDRLRRAEGGVARRVTTPVDRIVWILGPLLEFLARMPDRQIFADEDPVLGNLVRDLLITPQELFDQPVVEDLTTFDLFRLQRAATLAGHVRYEVLLEHAERDLGLVFRSIVGDCDERFMHGAITRLLGAAKAAQAIRLFSWRRDDGRVFDVQAHPLLRFGSRVTLPFAVAGHSNLVRNALEASGTRPGEPRRRRRGSAPPADDPPTRAERTLADALEAGQAAAKRGVPYRCGDMEGELDVVAQVDGDVFVFEVKHNLMPGGMHELRDTVDAAQTAGEQLDDIAALFDRGLLRPEIERRTGWEIRPDARLTCGIALTNRMLSGATIGAYRVCGLFELAQFCHEGEISLYTWDGERSEQRSVRLRAAGPIRAPDLRAFLAGEVLHDRQFASMVPFDRDLVFGDAVLTYHSYALDVTQLGTALGADDPSPAEPTPGGPDS